MGRSSSRISRRLPPSMLIFLLLLLGTTPQCEARALRQSKRNSLMNALFKLNFVREVQPTPYLPPPADASAQDGDTAASLAAAADSVNPPFCVNPPNAPPSSSTPPFSSTGPSSSTPSAPDQLPPITPIPPSFEPSPPAGTSTPGSSPGTGTPTVTPTPINPPQFAPSPPGTAPPSPIVVVPSPPNDSGTGSGGGSGEGGGGGGGGGDEGGRGGGGGGFMPPIIYPPPLAPPMAPGAGQAMWCVAKPTVPDPILQEAMDYACGSGAECRSIQPAGACSQPDTVLAHASYAFNSYWQMTRANGGTCDFGGTATIVTSDPSYDQCAFDLV
ncbi:translation initiation factor IF-2-like [Lolium rigidum]|uniref:translation initiation factor IF-2-like n=1 Tax=Lolium rigidum TaxID=89674 RepID=UPI001F5C4507|nr:translation initiation factor IF-2-like [Lolium rigidum]